MELIRKKKIDPFIPMTVYFGIPKHHKDGDGDDGGDGGDGGEKDD